MRLFEVIADFLGLRSPAPDFKGSCYRAMTSRLMERIVHSFCLVWWLPRTDLFCMVLDLILGLFLIRLTTGDRREVLHA